MSVLSSLIIMDLEPSLFPLLSAAVIVPNSAQLDGTSAKPGSVSASSQHTAVSRGPTGVRDSLCRIPP